MLEGMVGTRRSPQAGGPALDRREQRAEERDRVADEREQRADEREEHLVGLVADLAVLVADRHRRAQEAIERSRDRLAATRDRLGRSEAALLRSEASAARAQARIDWAASVRERELARQSPGAPVHTERAPVLRRHLSVTATALAAALEELAQIHEDLAGRDPPQASEYQGSAAAARNAAQQVRAIGRRFSG
jgi:hypothetical protein